MMLDKGREVELALIIGFRSRRDLPDLCSSAKSYGKVTS